jgi:predicted transposase YdaD
MAKRVGVVDADVSTVTAATDKVLRLQEPDAVVHFDFQAGPDASLPRRVHGYNALLEDRHGLEVLSVVVLLRPEADLRSISGVYERRFPGKTEPYLIFRYDVIRVWELPPEDLLRGGLGTLPLVPISAVTESALPGVIHRLKERLDEPGHRQVAGQLWTAVDVLMGLRYGRELIDPLLQGVRGMKESVTYQAIVEEGVVKGQLDGARQVLLLVGEQRFGKPPGARARAAIEAIHNLEELKAKTRRALQVQTWQELLAREKSSPAPRRRKKTR